MSDEKGTKLEITARGSQRIAEMFTHTRQVGAFYGTDSEAYRRTSGSLLTSLDSLLRLGGDIWSEGPDGDLSLGGRTESGFTYGVIAFTFPAESRLPDAVKPVEWSIHS